MILISHDLWSMAIIAKCCLCTLMKFVLEFSLHLFSEIYLMRYDHYIRHNGEHLIVNNKKIM